MTFTNRVISLTQDRLLPVVVDNVINYSPLSLRLIGNAKKWSGESLKRPIKYQKSATGGSFSGLDTFSTSTSETRLIPKYDIRAEYQSVTIPGIEKAVNATEARVMDLVKTEMASARDDMMDNVAERIYEDGTGNTNKDFLGLEAIIDDATNVTTLAGISRSTYSFWKATVTASSGSITLNKLATLVSDISAGSLRKTRPTIFVTTETIWDFYEQLLTPTVRANYESFGYPIVTRTSKGVTRAKALKGTAGFDAVTYKGRPVVADEKCTSGVWYAVNENYLDWYGLRSADLKYVDLGGGQLIDGVYEEAPSKFHGFGWTGFKTPTNQFGEVGQIILMGNLVTWQPRRHGKLTGITSV